MSQPLPIERPDLESSTERYADRFAGSVGSYFLDVQWNTVRRLLPSSDECRVLDVGGGHAQLTPRLVQAGYDVTVFGSDDACVSRLDRLAGKDNYRFVAGNLLGLPFDDNSHDVVLAFRLLPHLENWKLFVRELCRVARQCVIVDYPDLRSINWLSDRFFGLKKRIETNTRRYRCFHKREVSDAFKASGFENIHSHGQFAFPMAAHRLMRSQWISRASEQVAKSFGLTQLLGSPVVLRAAIRG